MEQFLKLSSGALSFTGKTEGTGKNRHYELAVKGKTAEDSKPKNIWVGINKDGTLYIWDKESGKPSTPTGTEKSSSKNT